MSVVIVGGNDRMVCQYKDVCKDYGCRAKVFTQMDRTIKKKLGTPGFDDSVYWNSSSQNGNLCHRRSKTVPNSDCAFPL